MPTKKNTQLNNFLLASDNDVDTNTKEMVDNEDLQNNTVLHLAAWNNDVITAELCLENGANVNSKKCDEASALHLAAIRGNLEVAELLISRGAFVNVKDGDSKTPLHRYALENYLLLHIVFAFACVWALCCFCFWFFVFRFFSFGT